VRRNHRKLITIDGRTAFVSGLCIGQMWEGVPAKKLQPWRDTGIEIVGPAVDEAEASFAESWSLAGGVGGDVLTGMTPSPAVGAVNLRLIPTEPFTGNLLRLDLLVASVARRSLWITDAYFIGTGPYLEALKRAARDGVDVRLLLPQGSDVGWVVPISRSLYRPLLEAGVRIFEWNGTMVHAKSAVADGRWGRIGSTNLNLNSWMGNWELDVAVEDEGVARTMQEHFEEDLSRSTEIVLRAGASPARPDRTRARPFDGAARPPRGSRRIVRSVTGVGRSIGAAVTGNRPLEAFEVVPLVTVASLLIAIAAIAVFAPFLIAWPLAAVAIWIAVSFFVEAWAARRR
jgi:phosphatidylserine/phosphatidylglycerophosphate/cardiolipin synthase-like enzyme